MEDTRDSREMRVEHGFDPARPRPPRVRAWPLVGSSFAFLRDPQALLLGAYREHGPVHRLSFGPQEYVVISGLEGAAFPTSREGRKVVSSEGVWDESARIMGASPLANMTNVDGARHAELRGLFRAGMSKSAAHETLDRSLSIAEDAFQRTRRRGRPVDSVAFSRTLVFEQLGHAMAGIAPQTMFGAADTVLKAIVRGVRVPLLRHFPLSASLKNAVQDVREVAEDILASRSLERPTFVQEVLQGLESGVYASTDLPMLMLTPFIAGLDTMAHTFAFVLYRLARHSDWRTRLRDEADRAVAKNGRLDADAVAQCTELGYFIQEVMRIHPLSPALIRVAKSDFALEGFQIRKGEALFLPHTITHFMEELFPDPHRFDPLRFHPERGEHRGAARYSPFGVGAHVCLGAGTAEVLLRANAAAILHHAEVTAADPRYTLRVSNLSGACPVGFDVRVTERAAARSHAA